MRLLGIDCSLNSTAICDWNDKKPTEYKYIIYGKYSDKEMEKLYQKFKLLENVTIQFNQSNNKLEVSIKNESYIINQIDRDNIKNNYVLKEQTDLENNVNISNRIVKDLKLDFKNDEVCIGLEGFSFASKGNTFIDLIKFNQSLRMSLYNFGIDIEKFNVYSPSTVKKFVGKGNYNKTQMCDNYILKKPHSILSKLVEFDETLVFQGAKRKVRKPFEDLVDAFWVNKKMYNDI